ncbi:MAG: ATP-binding protein [Pirellulales bacterium]|nr:ATP-binding protein [Pirellulales bacterium]
MLIETHNTCYAGTPKYDDFDTGDERPVRCLRTGLWIGTAGSDKLALLVTQAAAYGRCGVINRINVQICVPEGDSGHQLCERIFAVLDEAVQRSASYRGRVLSFESRDSYQGTHSGITVHRLRTVMRDQVILPQATLELLDRNVLRFVEQREALRRVHMPTKKGLLFYGPPGTGKTHTIHYLSKELRGHTTLLIAAEQVGNLGEYMTLARLLQPSIVVIEDADLIARERTQMETIEEVLLNKLLNEMDGLREDADILFIRRRIGPRRWKRPSPRAPDVSIRPSSFHCPTPWAVRN